MAVIKPFFASQYNEANENTFFIPDDSMRSIELDSFYNIRNHAIHITYPQDMTTVPVAEQRISTLLSKNTIPAFYTLHQDYINPYSGNQSRKGILALLDLESSYEDLIPHELTHDPYIDIKESYFKQSNLHTFPVFALFENQDRILESIIDASLKAPLIQTNTRQGAIRIGQIEKPEIIQKIQSELLDNKIFIADGHHRIEASYNLYKSNREKYAHLRYVYIFLANYAYTKPDILPFYRLYKTTQTDLDLIENQFINHFNFKIQKKNQLEHLELFIGGRHYSRPLDLNNSTKITVNETDEFYKAIVGKVFESYLKKGVEKVVSYTFSRNEALQFADEKKGFVVKLPVPPIDEIINSALENRYLPQKTTCFYPKVPAGILIRHIGFERGMD